MSQPSFLQILHKSPMLDNTTQPPQHGLTKIVLKKLIQTDHHHPNCQGLLPSSPCRNVVETRVSKRMSCDESAIFFTNLA